MLVVFPLLLWTVLARRGSEEPSRSWNQSLRYAGSVSARCDQKGMCPNGRVAFSAESRSPWWHVLHLEIVRPVISRWAISPKNSSSVRSLCRPSCRKMAVVLACCFLSVGEIGSPARHSRFSYAGGPAADGFSRPRTDYLLGLYSD